MPLLALAACAAIFCVIGFFMAEVKEPPKGGGGASGGGSYRGGGFGDPNGSYRPEYRRPPPYYGSFGEDESGHTGYPPFGTC